MNCGACVQRVEGALRDVSGVVEAVVNLMNESASVTTEAEGLQQEQLITAVRAIGYDAEILASSQQLVDRFGGDAEQRETLRRHRQAVIQAVGYALPVLVLEYSMPLLWGATPDRQITARLMQILLLIMLARTAGAPILISGLQALLHRVGNMDLLVSMSVVVAFVSSLYGIFVARDNGFIHLNAAAMILMLVCVGRYLEVRAKGHASQAMFALAGRAPKRALVRKGEEWVSMPVANINVGDYLKVPDGEAIPVDGEVTEGKAAVNESLMTGEAMPVEREAGETVLGGTVVVEGMIVVRANGIGSRSALGRILQLVHKAQATRTQMQRLADRIASIFTPTVIAVAVLVFVGWLAIGGASEAARGTRSAVAVLVVACPCALGLATPTVVLVASGVAALRGILVREAGMLEAMGQVDTVVWDKTGTLTRGELTVGTVETTDGYDESAVLRLAASAEQFSNHPVGQAIVSHARRRGVVLHEPTAFKTVPGSGVLATVDGQEICIGKPAFIEGQGVRLETLGAMSDAKNGTLVVAAIDGKPAGIFCLTDSIRPSSSVALSRLRSLGLRNEMLTGDHESAARAVAEQAGIPDDGVVASVDPEGKVSRITELKRQGRRVAMVGDGVNDAAALATADVGIAFATGADVASEAAGINLIGSTPHLVADAVQLARVSVRVIHQNLFWAFIYNILMIPLAATGRLSPAVAAGAMMISSLTVVLNALRLPKMMDRVWRAGR